MLLVKTLFSFYTSIFMVQTHVPQTQELESPENFHAVIGELERMNAIIQASASVLDIQKLMTIMLNALRTIVPFDLAGIELLNDDGDTFTYLAPEVFVHHHNQREYANIPHVRLSAEPPVSLIQKVFADKSSVFIRRTELEQLPPFQRAHFAITPWTSLLMVPMETMGRMIGCAVFTGVVEFELEEADIASIERLVQQFTVIFANARQYQQLQMAALETEIVELFVRIINREKEFEPLLKTILYQIGYSIPDADKASVMVYQPESNDFRFVQTVGYDFEEFKSISLSYRDTIERWMMQEQCAVEGIFIVRTFSRVKFETVFSAPCSAIALRLEVEGELAGLLFLDSFNPNFSFRADDVRRVAALHEHINSAFAKALSLQRLREQSRQLQESYAYLGALSDIARDVTSSLEVETVLNALYKHIHRLMDATVFEVGLSMGVYDIVRFEFAVVEGKREAPFDISIDDTNHLAVRCIKNRMEISIDDVEAELDWYVSPTGSSSFLPQSLLMIPLIVEERVIGVMSVQSPRKNAYSHYHREMFRSIASTTVSALLNAEKYREIHRQQYILEEQAAEIELINSELSDQNSTLERSERLMEEQSRKVERSNAELQEKNLLLQQIFTEKNEMLSIVAHDLKNPLSSVIMSVELLQRYAKRMTSEEQVQRLDSILTVALRMSSIINHLLNIDALEAGLMRPSLSLVNVYILVESVLSEYRERAEAKNIAIHLSTNGEQFSLQADTTFLHEIIENIISNAIKYSPHGKRVLVRVLSNSDTITIKVQDEGQGISPEDMPKLFGKYARLSARPTGGEHSTGLGLSIVKKMVEAMNGKVWCESELGKGATFIVELPIAQVVKI
jgi:signal transduction histidine kinase